MKPSAISTLNMKRRQAMALVMVVTTVALISMLIVAIFSLTRTEYKASQSFVAARSAKQLGDIGVAIVQAQIQNAQNTATATSPAARKIHATQPGMVRVYNANGTFERAHKLYSSAQMVVQGSSESVLYGQAHQVPADWGTKPARFVDLNDPVVRPALTAGQMAVYFPVIDPRAAYNTLGSQTPSSGSPTTQVEGFSYSDKTAGSGGQVTYQEVVLPTEVSDSSQLRLPMPVEWMYLLQDGTTGALDDSNKFVSSNSTQPSSSNPIVGRVAFWTDDESCKVNINTASEPTYMSSPYFYHERDRRWAHFPASSGEYQRYPGHPATVALSAVLAPGYLLDPLAPGYMTNSNSPSASGLSRANVLAIKEYIYNMAPKIAQGGSLGGTVPFARDDFSTANDEPDELNQLADTQTAKSERLYASVDEMLFNNSGYDTTVGREQTRFPFPGAASRFLFDQDTLEKSRFFLTAHSRAPEFSMFGLPRVSIWPVADETLGDNMRNSFDNMIALCSTLASGRTGAGVNNSYIFRRALNRTVGGNAGQTFDLPNTGSGGLARNARLLDYLVSQMSDLTWPSSNLGSSAHFEQKYGADNVKQLAVQFFDYIRSTNLYDGVQARDNNPGNITPDNPASLPTSTALYNHRDNLQSSTDIQRRNQTMRTYTDQRMTLPPTDLTNVNNQTRKRSDDAAVFPGHGMVTPAVWNSGGQQYRGFGRMFTLSEVGFNFICTADGRNDSVNPARGNGGVVSGGGAATRVDPLTTGNPSQAPITTQGFWYSNFPPLNVNSSPALRYGTVPTPGSPFHPSNHPGYNPQNWNYSLPENTPLETDEKRIQAIFLMESFCPSLGWTKFHPEYSIVVDGDFIKDILLNEKPLFDTAGPVDVRSNGNLFEANNVHSVGGHSGPTAMAGGRVGRPVSGTSGAGGPVMNGSDSNWSGNPTGHIGLMNYGLTSNFVTVKRGAPLRLKIPSGDLKIEIYDTHSWQNARPIQTVRVRFNGASSNIPMPHLVGAEPDPGSGLPRGGPFSNHYVTTHPTTGEKQYRIALQAPKYWCYNVMGCLGRQKGRVNPAWSGGPNFWLPNNQPQPDLDINTALRQSIAGRLDTRKDAIGFSPPGGSIGFSIFPDETSDVTRSLVPAVGDYRIIAARYNVPPELWRPHPSWNTNVRQAHSFSNYSGHTEPGARLATVPNDTSQFPVARLDYQMVAGIGYNLNVDGSAIPPTNGNYNSRQPDLPGDPGYATAANSFGDFDSGIANAREGPYINKPDEGNFFVGNPSGERFNRAANSVIYRSGYFFESWRNSEDWRSGIFMTPNRIVSSPVMFGSLPTGVWNTGGSVPSSASATAGTAYAGMPARPWQTLLFRPHALSVNQGASRTKTNHPGEYSPRDHLLLDMFFMPVVEPYAISEPLSVAGRINLNYQIMPFTNIKRATGLHALMKGEYMTAIPNADATRAKTFSRSTAARWDEYWNETTDRRFWHRPIDVTETLRQFDERFENDGNLPAVSRGLFRTASQICEMHLIPADRLGTNTVNVNKPTRANNRQSQMNTFWLQHSVTGDNVRERPYSNIYSRVTTRSNTFRVHMRAQVIRKARSVAVDTVDPVKDAIVSEYRGSTLIERYIDPTDVSAVIPDYAASSNPLSLPSLETFYKFRTLESKRFSP
jgi:uncharacterized protein (TIGR02600 family)